MKRGYWKFRAALMMAQRMLIVLLPAIRERVPDAKKADFDAACKAVIDAITLFLLIPIDDGNPASS